MVEQRSVAATCPATSWNAHSQLSRPNIVVIMTDDHDARMMGVMTYINALLGKHGVTFSHRFVSTPLCCPSRATFLTGQEEAIGVPLVIRGPGFPEGCGVDHLVVNIDLAPTIVELARASPDLAMDGRSFLPLLRDSRTPWRQDFLVEHWRAAGETLRERASPPTFAGVRTDRYLYAITSELHFLKEREFYDLVIDPFQLNYLIKTQDKHPYKNVVAHLQKRLQALTICAGEACFGPPLRLLGGVLCMGTPLIH